MLRRGVKNFFDAILTEFWGKLKKVGLEKKFGSGPPKSTLQLGSRNATFLTASPDGIIGPIDDIIDDIVRPKMDLIWIFGSDRWHHPRPRWHHLTISSTYDDAIQTIDDVTRWCHPRDRWYRQTLWGRHRVMSSRSLKLGKKECL
jgi:hypothetical protein